MLSLRASEVTVQPAHARLSGAEQATSEAFSLTQAHFSGLLFLSSILLHHRDKWWSVAESSAKAEGSSRRSHANSRERTAASIITPSGNNNAVAQPVAAPLRLPRGVRVGKNGKLGPVGQRAVALQYMREV